MRKISLLFMIVMLAVLPVAYSGAEPSIKILPLPVDRGTAARVAVEGLSEADELSGQFDGRPVLFFPVGRRMVGLFGADIMLSPGRYPLNIRWRGGEQTLEVAVRDRSYGVRSITVPPNQAQPSKSDQDRAARERKIVLNVLDAKSPERLWRGPWVDPVGGSVSSSFGRQTRINGVLNPRPHNGTDFDVPTGTPVKAPAAGVVALADFHFYAGGSVYIDHGLGLVSMYFHLSELKVQAGETVERGHLLGLSGETGRVTGPHLHYGVYLCGARIDPVAFQRLTALVRDGAKK